MNGDVTPEQLAGAAAYNELLVPALFEEWAPRGRQTPHESILGIGCSTSHVERES